MQTLWLLIVLLAATSTSAQAKVRIVASTADLGSIALLVGGDNVKVDIISNGNSDPHYVELLPSYMVKVARAAVYLKVGGGLDYWADQIIDGSNNGKLDIVDCSRNIDMLEKPTQQVNASMGDIHPNGNPHYWLDPQNGVTVATTIAAALSRVDPKNSKAYNVGLERFSQTLAGKIAQWREKAKPLEGMEIVTYHNSWPYFTKAFGIKVVGFVQPKPGIEATPSHTAALIDLVNERNIKIIGLEPFYSDRAPNTIASQTHAKVVRIPTSVGGVDSAKDYYSLFDTLIDLLTAAK